MTLRQLEYVLAVARNASFTLAAEQLHVSQPTLSQQIRALEAEIGGQLLERPPGRVQLTTAGTALVSQAQTAVTSARRAVEAARRVIDAQPEMLILATVRSLVVGVLPESIQRWHERHPRLAIALKEFAHRNDVVETVALGEADLGVGPFPETWDGALREFGWEELVVVLPEADPLILSGGSIALEALASRDWVLFEEGHGLAEIASTACIASGFEPSAVVRTTQVEAAARLAAAGLGPTLVPARNVPPDLTSQRQLDPPVAWRVAAFVAQAEFPPLAGAFADVLAEGHWQHQPPAGCRELRLFA